MISQEAFFVEWFRKKLSHVRIKKIYDILYKANKVKKKAESIYHPTP